MIDIFSKPSLECLPPPPLQDGVINEIEALRAQTAGIEVIMDHCIYRDFLSCGVRKPLGWTGTC